MAAAASFSYKIGGGGKDLATLLVAVLTMTDMVWILGYAAYADLVCQVSVTGMSYDVHVYDVQMYELTLFRSIRSFRWAYYHCWAMMAFQIKWCFYKIGIHYKLFYILIFSINM